MSDKDQHNITNKAGHQPTSFDWRARRAKAQPLGVMNDTLFSEVCDRLRSMHEITRAQWGVVVSLPFKNAG